jgi:hypothetical protein
MNTYNITITNDNDRNDFATLTVTAEEITDLFDLIEKTTNYSDEFEFITEDGEYVVITQNSEHGYNADLYASREAYENAEDAIGGGLCTGTLKDAIEMAITCR